MTQLLVRNPLDTEQEIKLSPKQTEFFRSGSENTFLAGGWGSGKTYAGLMWMANAIVDNPGRDGIVMQPTFRILREFMQSLVKPAFKDWIVGESKTDGILYLRGGSRIIFISGHIIERLEFYTAAWAYIDEIGLLPRMAFTKMAARLRGSKTNKARMALTGTPHYGWLQEEFGGRNNENRRIIHVGTYDNPYTSEQYKNNLTLSCPSRMRKAYLEGHFVTPGGSVYPEWEPEGRNQLDWTVRRDFPVIPAVDWSPRVPHVIFVQMLPEGTEIKPGVFLSKLQPEHEFAGAVVVDELIPDAMLDWTTTQDLARMVIEKQYPFTHYVCDPAGKAREATSGRTNIRIFSEITGAAPLYKTGLGERLIANGVQMVRNMISPHDGVPRLYVTKDLHERSQRLPTHLRRRPLSNALREYGYNPPVDGKPVDTNPVEDGVTEHAADDIRYIAVYYFPVARLMERRLRSAA